MTHDCYVMGLYEFQVQTISKIALLVTSNAFTTVIITVHKKII